MQFAIRVTGFRNGKGQYASLARAYPGGARQMNESIKPEIVNKFREKTPQASGNLAGGWAGTVSQDGDSSTLTLSNNVGYLDAVIKGRKPGYIFAKDGGVLHFNIGGKEIFTKYVYHPGTAPNDFTRGIDDDYIRISREAMVAIVATLTRQYLTDG
jgi:hypothetical protein